MGEKIVIGPINRGLRTDREPFVIDNDSFPVLVNAYQWRGRLKRKRGTSLLGRLQRIIGTTDGAGNAVITISPTPVTSGIATFKIGTDVFVDPGGASPVNLLTNSAGTGTLNRATGVLTITGAQINTTVLYFPTLPVMGLEDLALTSTQFPGTIAFDTIYSYNITTGEPQTIYDVSFYKNPAMDAINLPGYVPKVTWTPTSWNGRDYQQFWTFNYQGALWATNGLDLEPFTGSNIGMQYAGPTTTPALTAAVRTSATTMQFTVIGNPLVVGDFVFVNEFTAAGGGDASTLNFQSGYVTTAGNVFTVTFPFANIPAGIYTPGIIQYLTNRSDTTKDCLRWYDGDPTAGSATTQTFVQGKGWVNFAPPLIFNTSNPFSITDLPTATYYLVGTRIIFPFKDRLLFFGPIVQTSTGSPIYLQDTVIWSQNGTPYYTASFIGDPTFANTIFHPILVPTNQTASASAYFEDVTGFGSFLSAGIDQPITTVSPNEDVLITGFSTLQSKLIYTGNDILPFNFFVTNSELGSGSTFSAITMDQGVLSRGNRGYIISNQTSSQRIDLEIPDQVFEINLLTNGTERVCSQRDFINEWVYFTYPGNNVSYKFPNTTLQFNYRDNSWAIFYESYTTYGTFRISDQLIWSNVGNKFNTWAEWNLPWNAGGSSVKVPKIIGGNQQGFILFRDEGTDEGNSLAIQNISGNVVTSPNHDLNDGDYIIITGCNGTVSNSVNGKTFSVSNADDNTFTLNPTISSGTYLGNGLIQRLYVPFIQTKQFPVAWEFSRKTRLGVQQYLLTTTQNGQIQLFIFLSQDSDNPYNDGPLVPNVNAINNSLLYSTTLYTCPESTNLGLTSANVNLQMPTAITQSQIWHRINTSLIGDTVQLGFTISDDQMRLLTPFGESFAITGASQATQCVILTQANFSVGVLVQITGIIGMTQLNLDPNSNNYYQVVASSATQMTLAVNSTAFTAYGSGGTIIQVANFNQSAEIELHGIILDVNPSQLLA